MLTVIDYGAGNLRNVFMALRRLGVESLVSSEAQDVQRADALILPGVGAFGDNIGSIRALGLDEPIRDAIHDGIPFLGICVGLQLLFEVSEEMGEHRGLGILPGRVVRFPQGLWVPHMGWNQIEQTTDAALWRGVPDKSYAYFVHSYYPVAQDRSVIAAETQYGVRFTSAIARDNLFAIQFHPEKSQDVGEKILKNFLTVAGYAEDSL